MQIIEKLFKFLRGFESTTIVKSHQEIQLSDTDLAEKYL